MLKSGKFNYEWFYEYYKKNFNKNKGKLGILPERVFNELFLIYFTSNQKEILANLNLEYEINFILDENGNYIYVD